MAFVAIADCVLGLLLVWFGGVGWAYIYIDIYIAISLTIMAMK